MQTEFKLRADNKFLKEVLFCRKIYRVPRYQRPYSWGDEEITEFWEDFTSVDEQYFLGSMIFNTEPEKKEGCIEIIDGQQRLLTVTILAAVLRDLAKPLDPAYSLLIHRQDIV